MILTPEEVQTLKATILPAALGQAERALASWQRERAGRPHTPERIAAETARWRAAIDALRRINAEVVLDPSARATLARLPVINDPIISEAMRSLET